MCYKSRSLVFIMIASLALILISCEEQAQHHDQTDEQKFVVYTSIYPLYDFTKKIAGEKAEVINLIPAGVEPHDYQPTAKEIMNISKAHLFVYNGADFESWVERIIESLHHSEFMVVDTTMNIPLLAHQKEDSHHHHEHGELDPHVWLDPNLAKLQAEAIKQALVQLDQENSQYYEENFAKLEEQFNHLDAQFQEAMQRVERRHFVVAHAAFGYLASRYDLHQVALAGINVEEPSPKQVEEMIRFVQEHDIEYILFENMNTPKVAEVVQHEVGAKSLVLHSLESLTEEDLSQGKDYFSIMEENLKVLKTALGYR